MFHTYGSPISQSLALHWPCEVFGAGIALFVQCLEQQLHTSAEVLYCLNTTVTQVDWNSTRMGIFCILS